MKKFSAPLLFSLLLALAALTAPAQTIRRVNNNNGITGPNIYATIQAGHDAATAGDIIQLEPSTVSYGDLTATKQLSVVGPGYFLSFNQPPALQASVIPATVGNVAFNAGSAGSSIAGVSVNSHVYLSANNIAVLRNKVGGTTYIGYYAAASNLLIHQNYLGNLNYRSYADSNVLITNNIVYGSVSLNNGNITGEFSNNVVVYDYSSSYFDNFTVKNNSATGYAYKLSGIPAIPAIYQLNQSVSVNSLNVSISTRSNN